MKLIFAKRVRKDVKNLDQKVQVHIKKKLLWFLKQENPLDFAEFLTDSEIGQYRFRIGDYRIIFDVQDQLIIVHLVGHRRDIYK